MAYFNYHAKLKHLLATEPYEVIEEKPPFALRFIFPQIGKSYPIREYRVLEYLEFLGGVIYV